MQTLKLCGNICVCDILIIFLASYLDKKPIDQKEVQYSMNKYELTVVVNAMTEDDVRTAVIDKVKELVAKCGGTITAVEEAGKKKLAYEIKKMNEAFYYFFQVDGVAEFPAEIAAQLRIMDNVLRFLCVNVEE